MSWGQEGLSAGTTLVLALLLGPSDFGVVVLALTFVGLMELIAAQGYHGAIVQRPDLKDVDLDSIFWTTLVSGLLMTAVSILGSGLVAAYFGLDKLGPLIQVLSVAILMRGLTVVQEAKLTREMGFRSLALRTNLSVIVGAGVGIGMAAGGWGVWALVGQYLGRAVTALIVLWGSARWTPRFRMDVRRLRELTWFSSKFFPATLFDFIGQQAEPVIMGSFFGPAAVGMYRLALRLVDFVVMLVTRALWYVSFPYFAEASGNPDQLRKRVLDCVRIASCVALPLFVMIAAEGNALSPIFGAKWDGAIVSMQVLCAYGAFRCLSLFAGPLLFAVGLPHVQSLMMGIQCAAICLVAVAAGYLLRGAEPAQQVIGMAWARGGAFMFVVFPMALYYMVRTIKLPIREFLKVIGPGLVGAAAAVSVDLVLRLLLNDSLTLLLMRVAVASVVAPVVIVLADPNLHKAASRFLSMRRELT